MDIFTRLVKVYSGTNQPSVINYLLYDNCTNSFDSNVFTVC